MSHKTLLCVLLALTATISFPDLADSQTNSMPWATFTDSNRHFHFQYPASWKINTEVVSVMHYREVFVSLNSATRSTVGDVQVSTNAWGYGASETIEQLPAGAVYMDIGWWEYPAPRFGPGIHEMQTADLSALPLQSEETKNKQLVTHTVEFSKWGRRWSIVVYLRAPFSDTQQQEMDQILHSFRFDGVPAGDAIWAISEARKKLPPEADPDEFTREGGSAIYYDQTKKDGNDVIVAFTKQFGDGSKKTWCYRVSENGAVLPMESSENPFRSR